MDDELILAATKNIEKYIQKNSPGSHQDKFTFLLANALEFNYKNEPTVYFMFNPFNAEVLEKVLNKICSSTTSETYFVYMNPKHAEVFKTENFKLIAEFKTKLYIEALVFKLENVVD